MTEVESATALAEIISEYGFLIVFAAVCLGIMMTSVYIFIRRWESNNKTHNDSQREKSRVEIELMQQRTSAEIEQSSKMFDLVTEVQTNQIAQMRSITDVINLLKDEINNNNLMTQNNSEKIITIDNNISCMLAKYENIDNMNNEILNFIKTSKCTSEEILYKLDILIKLMTKDEK